MEKHLTKQLNKLEMTPLVRITIPRLTNNVFYPVGKSRELKKYLMGWLLDNMEILPMYGGATNMDNEFEVVVCMNNSDRIKFHWGDGFNPPLYMLIFNSDIERWLWQKKLFFGWK